MLLIQNHQHPLALPASDSSKQRYEEFRRAYREGRADELADQADENGDEKSRAPKEQRRQYLRLYARWLWPYRWAIVLLALFSLAAAALEMVSPLFMRYIIDKVLLLPDLDLDERLSKLHAVGIVYLLCIIVNQLFSAKKNYDQRKLNVRVILSLRQALYERLLHLPLSGLSEMKTGGIISRLSGDVDRTTGLLQMAIISPFVSIVRLLIAMGVLFYLNWQLAVTALAILPGIMLISIWVTRRIRPIYRAMRKDNAALDARVSETFGGIRVVRSFQRELRELAEYMTGRHTIVRKELFAHRRELVLWNTWGFLLAAVNVVIVWFGGFLYVQGRATVGDIMAFQWYTFLLLNPVWQLVNSFTELQRSLAGMERVFRGARDAAGQTGQARRHGRAAGCREHQVRRRLVRIQPRSARDPRLLRDVPGGQVVALVGRSGAGKTTITDLVARFYDPTRGAIRLNGTDIRDFRLASYRNLLAVVQQEVFLFDGTVRENIAYGRRHASEAQILDAARRANADEFIQNLPDKYDSIVGERGVKLSGGQCQRLSIARAILADPQILILDEATSNLDTASEQLIQQSLVELLRGRTTFVIAHRLSTITGADQILVLDGGPHHRTGHPRRTHGGCRRVS